MELRKNFYSRIWLAGLIFVLWLSSVKPTLAVDGYEPDDTYGQANIITTDGVVQTHDFDPAGDNDWVKFSAVGGEGYVIATSNLGENCDTYIGLYDTNGITQLEWNDDSRVEPFASRIIWTASGPGTYYVMARHFDDSVGGAGTNYGIAITPFTPGSISGTVTNMSGTPLPDIYITVYDSDWDSASGVYTDTNGTYVINGLPAGDYRVWALPAGILGLSETDYASEYYDDILDYQDATPVSVTAGTNTADIGFGLAAGGSISGTISYSGSTMGDVYIGVFTASSYTPFWPTAIAESYPGPYSFKGIASGEWYVAALMDLNYNHIYDSGEPFGEYALNPVSVTAGTDTPDINIELNGVPRTNNPPVIDPIGDKTVNEGELLTFVITAADPDGDPLSYSASNLPSNASFDPAAQRFSWTPGYDQTGYSHVWFTVSDGELGDIEVIMITVNDVDGDGCSCETNSAGSSESLKTEQIIGFFLPFSMVFLTIVVLIRRRERRAIRVKPGLLTKLF